MSISCPSCGTEAAEGAKFCANCGSSLAQTCPHCGAEASPGAKFCANCGNSLAPKLDDPARAAEEKKLVSVLFADLAGFTARTERSDPEDVRARLTVYHRTVREQVEARGGKVEKLMGDGVFAVFGVPVAHEDDPERAVRAALRIQDEIDALNEDQPDLGLSVRIAVTTGEAIVQLDPDNKDRESIVGDVVNTASRLEAVAPEGGVVVDERTYLATRAAIEFVDLDSVDLKGKATPTAIWQATHARARQGVAVTERHKGPFVGRDRELAVLVDSLHRTQTSSTVQMITIVGEPGSGKSRLLHEFKAILDRMPDEFWWKQGRCLPYGEGITFWALGEIVKAQAGILETDSDEEAKRKLRHAVVNVIDDEAQAEWVQKRLSPLAGTSTDEQSAEQGELFSAWLRFLTAMAQRHPLVMVVEDVHWADPALLDFLEHLAEWAVDVPILLMTTARPEFLSDRPDWGSGIRNAATLTLSPLRNNDAARLLAALLDRAVLPAESQQTILERAGGNPLYVTEFVRLAEEANLLDESGRLEEMGLPTTVQAIIGARLDLLGTDEKDLLQAAAVVGKVFWSGAVAALRPSSHSRDALRELMRRELIRPIRDPSMHGQEEYAFVHALVRDVAYGRLARDDRAHLHQATASWIEATSGERGVDVAELLAYHLGEAVSLTPEPDEDLRRRAFRALMQAAERARELDARQGVSYYRRAAQAAEDPGQRAEALRLLGNLNQDDIEEAVAALREAITLFNEAGDRESEARALGDLSGLTWWRGEVDEARALADRAAELLEREPDSQAKADVLIRRVNLLVLRGSDREALELADEIAPLVERHGSTVNQISLLARASMLREDMDGMYRAMRMADEANITDQMLRIRNNITTEHYRAGSPRDGLSLISEALELAYERAMPSSADWMKLTKSETHLWLGEWDEVVTFAEELIATDDERGGSQAGDFIRVGLYWVRFVRGEDVRDDFSKSVDYARSTREQQTVGPVMAFGVSIWGAYGDAYAVELADEFDSASHGGYRAIFLPFVTGPLVAMGEVQRARAIVERTEQFDGSQPTIGRARAEGHLALASGDESAAASHFAESVAISDEYDHVYLALEARVDLASVLDPGDPRFSETVDAARATASRMGATRLLDRLNEIEGLEEVERARA